MLSRKHPFQCIITPDFKNRLSSLEVVHRRKFLTFKRNNYRYGDNILEIIYAYINNSIKGKCRVHTVCMHECTHATMNSSLKLTLLIKTKKNKMMKNKILRQKSQNQLVH
jgi:hypothetical protein